MGSIYELVDIEKGQKTGAYLDVKNIPDMISPLFKGARCWTVSAIRGISDSMHLLPGLLRQWL